MCSDGSLSARRAWIEIRACTTTITICTASLSARRAWIEMTAFTISERVL